MREMIGTMLGPGPGMGSMLTSLMLNKNCIGDHGFEHLTRYVATVHCKLQKLGVSENCITDRGVGMLRDAMLHNQTLSEVLLNDNEVALCLTTRKTDTSMHN